MTSRSLAFFVRMDKIGDLVCTLPCDEIVGLKYDVEWILHPSTEFVVQATVPRRMYTCLDIGNTWRAFRNFFALLRSRHPEAVIVFQGPWWISFAAFLARVPLRGGRVSQWHSFLFLNRGLRQSRSEALFHEAEYNQQLVAHAFGLPSTLLPDLLLEAKGNRRWKEKFGLEDRNYVVVHPGMAGSALNWPESHYADLIGLYLQQKKKVVLTGITLDVQLVERILKHLSKDSLGNIINLVGRLSAPEWLQILAGANEVIGPSSGVVHLAASLGRPVKGIYSPVQVQRARRWGPRGALASTISPAVSDCPAIHACLLSKCPHHPCMALIPASLINQKKDSAIPDQRP